MSKAETIPVVLRPQHMYDFVHCSHEWEIHLCYFDIIHCQSTKTVNKHTCWERKNINCVCVCKCTKLFIFIQVVTSLTCWVTDFCSWIEMNISLSVGWLVGTFGPDWNISITLGLIEYEIKLVADICGPQKILFIESPDFSIAPTWNPNLNLPSTLVYLSQIHAKVSLNCILVRNRIFKRIKIIYYSLLPCCIFIPLKETYVNTYTLL